MSLTKASYSMVTGAPVNVLDFGAVGDGVADDGAAIRAAIASITPSGGQVYLPAGTYKITAAVGDASNTAIFVPSNVRVVGASQVGTKIVPGANNTVCFRVIGLNGGIENLQIDNVATTYTNVSGIRLAPTDETQTTTRSDVEFNNITNISIRRVAEGIVLKCGPTVGGQDSYCYYNTFTNIDIRNTTLGIWLKEPTTQPGSGNNRNTFISIRVGETGTNTGLKIDAGDTNKFFGCAFEGIQTGTSPNAVPTAVQIAYNTISYSCVHNQFYGLIAEACTRGIDNDNDFTEFYGWYTTDPYFSPSGYPLAVDLRSGGLSALGPITGTSHPVTASSFPFSINGVTVGNVSNASGDGRMILTSGTQNLRLRISDAKAVELGNDYFAPLSNGLTSLGLASLKWSEVFASSGTINTSDQRNKQDEESLNDAEKRVALAVKGLIKKFRFKDAVERKGNDARIHVGVMAQEVIAAFEAEELDPMRYGIVCYDEWEATPAEIDEDGNITREAQPAGNAYGIRYEELFAFIIAAL
jgi:hypothetical protein